MPVPFPFSNNRATTGRRCPPLPAAPFSWFGSERLPPVLRPVSYSCYLVVYLINNKKAGPAPAFSALALQVSLPQLRRQFLHGIPEHGPGHSPVVAIQEIQFPLQVPVPHFPQHPTHGFVNQVMGMIQQ